MKSPHYGKTFLHRRDPVKRFIANAPCARDGTYERYTRDRTCCACVLRRVRERRALTVRHELENSLA